MAGSRRRSSARPGSGARPAPEIAPAAALSILVVTCDEALAGEVERACHDREYQLTRVTEPVGLASMIAADRPDALLLDLGDRLQDALVLAETLSSCHPDLKVVIVGESSLRSRWGFRIVDRWRAGERVVDQLELAYIGIPTSIGEDVGVVARWDERA
jgi:PleD family two-component response regulator